MSYKFLQDPKFWTAVIDVLVSLVLYFAGKYAAPSAFEDIKVLIVAVQPVVLIAIVGLLQRDSAAIRNGQPLSHLPYRESEPPF
jgi:hypothetical protein